jgi:hypothetical protein
VQTYQKEKKHRSSRRCKHRSWSGRNRNGRSLVTQSNPIDLTVAVAADVGCLLKGCAYLMQQVIKFLEVTVITLLVLK